MHDEELDFDQRPTVPRAVAPMLLSLTEEDFQRGYLGDRPPSLLSPAPVTVTAAPPPRARSAKPLAIVASIAALAALSYAAARPLLRHAHTTETSPAHTTEAPPAPPPRVQPLAPITIEPSPVAPAPQLAVASATATPQLAIDRPAAPRVVVPVAAKPVAKSVEKPANKPTASSSTYGIEEAGF